MHTITGHIAYVICVSNGIFVLSSLVCGLYLVDPQGIVSNKLQHAFQCDPLTYLRAYLRYGFHSWNQRSRSH